MDLFLPHWQGFLVPTLQRGNEVSSLHSVSTPDGRLPARTGKPCCPCVAFYRTPAVMHSHAGAWERGMPRRPGHAPANSAPVPSVLFVLYLSSSCSALIEMAKHAGIMFRQVGRGLFCGYVPPVRLGPNVSTTLDIRLDVNTMYL
jgi:hypothetical protein